MTAKPCMPVEKVENFMAEVVKDFEEVESKIIVLKVRLARRTISEASIMRELDEIVQIIRR